MPTRFHVMLESVALLGTSLAAALSAAVAALSDLPAPDIFAGPAILDDERFRLYCLIGAVLGAVVNLGLYGSNPLKGIQPVAWKIFGSVATGIVFTPIAMKWRGVPANIDTLLAVSFCLSIVGVGSLRMLITGWNKWIAAKLGLSSHPPVCLPPPPAATPVHPPPPQPPTPPAT